VYAEQVVHKRGTEHSPLTTDAAKRPEFLEKWKKDRAHLNSGSSETFPREHSCPIASTIDDEVW